MTITDQLIDACSRARRAGYHSIAYCLSDQALMLLEQELIASFETISEDAGAAFKASIEQERTRRLTATEQRIDAGKFRGAQVWNDRSMSSRTTSRGPA